MEQNVFISIYLDTRRAKATGNFPVKLRVFTSTPRKQKLYPTTFEFSDKDFKSIWETAKPRNEHKEIRLELQAIENKANEAAKNLKPFTFEQFEKNLFMKKGEGENVIYQYNQIEKKLNQNKQFGTANNYKLSLKSLLAFIKTTKGKEPSKLLFTEITPEWLEKYERYMVDTKERSITTVSMYLRALRTVFNQAISEKEIESEIYPFGKRKYQVPAVRNVKKSLSKTQLKQLFEAVPETKDQQRAKDFWFFSYSCNGMNMKDIALLKYENLQGDKLVFYREKTKKTGKADLKPIIVYLNEYTKGIIEKYGNPDKDSKNEIFPIISKSNEAFDNFRAIKNFIISINKNMKKVALKAGVEGEISTYWARHSFATSAIRSGASMEFVSEALNHNNMKTTQNYFAGFDDEDKRELMNSLMVF